MTTDELAAEIQGLLDNGWLPCGTCEGKAYANGVPGAAPHRCDDCHHCGFFHPFLGMEEYLEQIARTAAGRPA